MAIANRTFEKSQVLATKVSGYAIPFSDVPEAICHSDLVISAISVKEPLFTEKSLSSLAMSPLGSRQILIIDISQPRSIDERVGYLRGIFLKTIDDLKQVVDQNLRKREIEAERVRTIIAEELDRFGVELSKLIAQPLIIEIFRSFEEIRSKEVSRAIRKMGETDEKKLAIMDRFSRELIERVAQAPTIQLRKAALAGDEDLLEAAARLFQIKSAKTEPA